MTARRDNATERLQERRMNPRVTFGSGRRRLATSVLVVLALGTMLLARSQLDRELGPRPTEAAILAGDKAAVSILAWFDFPRSDPRSAELSGVAWDAASGTLYAITDDAPRIIPIRPSPDYRNWAFGEPIAISVPDEMWDGEGIVLTGDGFIISTEIGPKVYELDRAGQSVGEVPVPAHFSRILRNRGFEALGISPDGRHLFFANEGPLEGDGPQPGEAAGGMVRIVRYDRVSRQTTEYAYLTDPIPPPAGEGADRGVVEIVALSGTDLLILERSFIPNFGNDVRIYRASVAGAANVLDVANLTAQTPTIVKTLLVDLGSLPDAEFPMPRQPQPNRILDNYEAMTLGPALADGRRVLFVVSDDNKRDTQTPRVLVLAVAGL
jgi:hypothetical protein